MLSALVLYAYCGVVCLFMIRLGIIRILSSICIFSSALYPPSAFSHPRFILHPYFLIRVLSSIRIVLSAFYPYPHANIKFAQNSHGVPRCKCSNSHGCEFSANVHICTQFCVECKFSANLIFSHGLHVVQILCKRSICTNLCHATCCKFDTK